MRCIRCWLLVHFSCTAQAVPSCAAMCPCTAVAVGPRLVRYLTGVTHTCARTQTEAGGLACERMYTPFAGSCRNHMFYKNPGEGEERHVTSSDISISAIKDTTAPKVSRCAVYASKIKSPNLSEKLHQTSLNTEIMLIYLYWEAHICCTLCSEWTIHWFINKLLCSSTKLRAKVHTLLWVYFPTLIFSLLRGTRGNTLLKLSI